MWTWLLGDFNGAAWRPCGNDRKPTSIVEEAFADTDLPMPPYTPPLWDPVQWLVNGLMFADFSSHQTPMKSGKYDYTVRFLSLPSTLGLREKDQGCHHEVWKHLALANPRGDSAPPDKHDQRLHLKERSSPYQLKKETSRAHGEQSDHSDSS